ncbi:hypothetical protein ERJ75_000295800 [Trypanosoma vivax]|nr:hypothetical protein ERJ75_000295800 [Trypanosoma vivax]
MLTDEGLVDRRSEGREEGKDEETDCAVSANIEKWQLGCKGVAGEMRGGKTRSVAEMWEEENDAADGQRAAESRDNANVAAGGARGGVGWCVAYDIAPSEINSVMAADGWPTSEPVDTQNRTMQDEDQGLRGRSKSEKGIGGDQLHSRRTSE